MSTTLQTTLATLTALLFGYGLMQMGNTLQGTLLSVRAGLEGFSATTIGLIGAALTYMLWFRGIARLESAVVSSLGFLSPVTAVLLGWLFLGQTLTPVQRIGVALVIGSIWFGQRAGVRNQTGGMAAQQPERR